MLGYAESDLSDGSLAVWDVMVHPQDKRGVYQKIEKHLQVK
jgi:hypothetical protein